MIHTMEKTPRVITKIGLVLEFINVVFAFIGYLVIDKLLNNEFLLQLDPETTTQELEFIEMFVPVIKVVAIVAGVISLIWFVINFYLFRGLYTERYTQEQAQKVYKYQFILGIIYLFLNTVAGILYLISGHQGKTGEQDMPYTREGI